MNKWLKRDYESDDGPLEGEIRNPEKKLRGYGNDLQEITSNLHLWMQRANMQADGTNDDNNDCYFDNDIDDNE